MSLISTLRAAAAVLVLGTAPALAQDKILNVSYDIARELFEALNPAFAADWKAKTGRDVTIDQSHAGSSAQARAVLEGRDVSISTVADLKDPTESPLYEPLKKLPSSIPASADFPRPRGAVTAAMPAGMTKSASRIAACSRCGSPLAGCQAGKSGAAGSVRG